MNFALRTGLALFVLFGTTAWIVLARLLPTGCRPSFSLVKIAV